jgi:hypothetical protein
LVTGVAGHQRPARLDSLDLRPLAPLGREPGHAKEFEDHVAASEPDSD